MSASTHPGDHDLSDCWARAAALIAMRIRNETGSERAENFLADLAEENAAVAAQALRYLGIDPDQNDNG